MGRRDWPGIGRLRGHRSPPPRVRAFLTERDTSSNKVNPRHARRFAEADGKLAKTDRVDTFMLAQWGAALDLQSREPKPKNLRDLAELRGMSDALVKNQTAAKTRDRAATLRETRSLIAKQFRLLASQIQMIDSPIIERVEADTELAERFGILQSVSGFGEVTAFTLLIEMSELGHFSGKQAASLASLAPIPRQSGKWRGREHFACGRYRLRRAIHMPALTAVRHNKALTAMAERLRDRGKSSSKVIITAIVRKMIVLAKEMLENGKKWRPKNT